jgi:hypothetical protein
MTFQPGLTSRISARWKIHQLGYEVVGILYLVNFLHFWQNFRIALQQNLLKKLVPRIFSFVAAVNGVSIRSRFRL